MQGSGRDIWKQYEEFKLLDKVLPNPSQTTGCFVQLDESSFGVIEQVSQLRSGEKREDVTKYLCHIRKGTQSDRKSEVIKAEPNKVKYLARAYLCRASELQTEKLSPKLLEAIELPTDGGQKVVESNLTSDSGETVTEGSLIVLIQTISAKTVTPEQQDVQQQPASLSDGTSLHRLHALV